MNPRFEKRYKYGEDAYVLGERLIGVLDGVGGWKKKKNVDVGLMSKELAKNIQTVYDSGSAKDLNKVIKKAVKRTENRGASTVVLAELSPNFDGETATLSTCNVGDCAYMLFRPMAGQSELMFRSEVQKNRMKPVSIGNHSKPKDFKIAASNEHKLLENDIIVMASDGVWDNLYVNQV